MKLLENKAASLSKRLYRQAEAMANTLFELGKFYPDRKGSVFHAKNFADGGVVIQGTTGKHNVTEVA